MMDYLFASDIHGSALWCERLLEVYKESGAKKLILLGDILYHGPRNDLPEGYAPKRVIELLNPLKDEILCVRGNCEAEVDQMVLSFPCMADYAVLYLNDICFYATHGHTFNELDGGRNLPPMNSGEVLIHGHTHVPVAERMSLSGKDIYVLNPGSVSIPKEGSGHCYGLLSGHSFTIRELSGEVCRKIELRPGD